MNFKGQSCRYSRQKVKDPNQILKEYWSFDSFREPQDKIVAHIMSGRDALVLLPTGGGKSICYQIPALAKEGVCIVVSPLIALMKDQVENLKKRNILADAIYSGLNHREIERILENSAYGKTKLLYVSPERLGSELFIERFKKMNVNLIAVDEAHCISQWGHDFRPAYLKIAQIREYKPDVPLVALTATATGMVRDEIIDNLRLKERTTFQKSFERENLTYSVQYSEDKYLGLVNALKNGGGSSLIYVRSRKKTQEISEMLKKHGCSIDFYHAGLSTEERNHRQQAWINNKIRTIVCTNAFGMGIDKPDVRLVLHLGLPQSLEEYYQEAGRAGRDGQTAEAVLLYFPKDGKDLRYFFEANMPDLLKIKAIYHSLGSHLNVAIGGGAGQNYDFDLFSFADPFQHKPVHIFYALQILEQEGYLRLIDGNLFNSSLCFRVDRSDLYNFQVNQPKFNPIIKCLLRNYEGLMEDMVKIDEIRMAKVMGRPLKEVILTLKKLDEYNVVRYEPRSEQTQITYLKPRLTLENLRIDIANFNFRYKLKKDKIEAVINFAENKQECRSLTLLKYFGENDAAKCGKCDVCLNKNESKVKDSELDKISKELKSKIGNDNPKILDLLNQLSHLSRDKVINTIRLLDEEGLVRINGDKQIEWIGN